MPPRLSHRVIGKDLLVQFVGHLVSPRIIKFAGLGGMRAGLRDECPLLR
jgi:hypothetical protein